MPTTWIMSCAYGPSGNIVACGLVLFLSSICVFIINVPIKYLRKTIRMQLSEAIISLKNEVSLFGEGTDDYTDF